MQWFRMWVDAIDDEKLKLLAFEDRWHYVAILCMKRKGILDVKESSAIRDRKVGIKLGLGVNEADEVRRRLREVKLIDKNWQPSGWTKRQFVSDADSTATERKRKQRDKERHGDVTRDSRAGHTAQRQTTESESDTEVVITTSSPSTQRKLSSLLSSEIENGLKTVSESRNAARFSALARSTAQQKKV